MTHSEMATVWLARKRGSQKMAPQTREALVNTYEAFLRVGRVSSEEWFALDSTEQACLLAAQKRLDVERAVMFASAIQPGGMPRLMSAVDGGKMLVRQTIDASIQRFTKRESA